MQIQENISLKPFNSFGINATARYFVAFSNSDELAELLTPDSHSRRWQQYPSYKKL